MAVGAVAHNRRRPLWKRRWLRVTAILVSVGLVAVASTVGWLALRYRSVPRVGFQPGVLPDVPRREPQNFLFVGSDSRAFADNPDEVTAYGTDEEVGPAHADTILLVRTFPDSSRVAMVSFPRDLWLAIAGTGANNRINTAVQDGGPDRLVQTISENFGISINHYVQIDFRGFKGLVNAVGGVELYFPNPVRDWDPAIDDTLTGLDIPSTGCVRLDGDEALSYVRSRHYQQLIDGVWQNDPAGDLNRITRQQDFLRRILAQALDRGLLDPRRLNSLIGVAVENVTLDDKLGLSDIAALSRQFRAIQAESLQTYAIPTVPARIDGNEVLLLDAVSAGQIFDIFRGQSLAPPTMLPNAVRLRVSDRTSTNRALGAAYRLAAAGFVVDGVTASGKKLPRTVIRYSAGAAEKAALLSTHIIGGAAVEADPSLQGLDVVLAIGSDWRGVLEGAASPVETPSTDPPAGAPAPTEVAPTETTTTLPPQAAAAPAC